jgi:hypothetical protein
VSVTRRRFFFPFNKRKQNMYKGVSWAGGPLKGKRKETSRGATKSITKATQKKSQLLRKCTSEGFALSKPEQIQL